LSIISGSSFSSIVALVFAFYAYLLGVGLSYNGEDYYDAISAAAFILLIIVTFKNIYFIDDFFSNGFYGSQVPTVFSGGGNIESTWIILLALFSRLKFIFSLFAFAVSMLYASRAGFISFIVVYYFNILLNQGSVNIRLFLYVFLMVCFALLLQFILVGNVLFDRIASVGDEANFEVGRIFLWGLALDLSFNNFMGYGVGLGVEAGRILSNIDFHENNFHNIYLQILVDNGAIGFFIFFSIILRVYYVSPANNNLKSLRFFLIAYLLLGLIQFTSLEMLFWFFLGVFHFKVNEYA
jgi:O-antigen ligase